MTKRTLLLASLVPMLSLGACGTVNRGLESVHQPVVSRADYVLDLGATPHGLNPGEERRLSGWMGSLRLGYGDTVSIDDPANMAAPRAGVAHAAAAHGLLLGDEQPVTGAPVAPGTIRVVITRFAASVPGCPDFTRVYEPNYNANTSSNHGCAVNSNLAAMIANPQDLVRGEVGSGTADPASFGKSIATYRNAAPSGAGALKSESTGGK